MFTPADERPADAQPQVPAPPTQILDGVQLAAPGTTRCQACGEHLREGERVVVYAYRPTNVARFDVPRVYHDADACRPDGLTGTLGCWDVLASATVALRSTPAGRSHQHVLSDVTLEEASGPNSGSEP